MSTKSKVFFVVASLISGITVYQVHSYQNEERLVRNYYMKIGGFI
jgi:hypothetical protein